MSALLTLEALSVRTPDHRPLFRDLTFSLGKERVGLVGRNGAGKSSLLRVIAGEIDSAAGTVRLAGTVGMLAQDWPPQLSVAKALGVAEDWHLLQRILAGDGGAADFDAADWTLETRIEAALAQVGLAGLTLDRLVGTLSGGSATGSAWRGC